jgi:hypothetical protein
MSYDKGTKYITAKKLRELLATIPDDAQIECNLVGNLSIYKDAGHWLGFIDLNDETVVWKAHA